MPSTNDLFIEELLNPVIDEVARNPTIVAVLIALRCTAIKGSEMSQVTIHNTECFCLYTIGEDPDQQLIRLSCGHAFHRSCIEEALNGEKKFYDPIPADDTPGTALTEPVEIVDSAVEWRAVEINRVCPFCRTVIIPDIEYDSEDGLSKRQAELMLEYFKEPTVGEGRMARLNDATTTGIEIAAAATWALDKIQNPIRARKRKERKSQKERRPSRLTRRQQDIADRDAQERTEVKPRTYRAKNGAWYLCEPSSLDDDAATVTSEISELTEFTETPDSEHLGRDGVSKDESAESGAVAEEGADANSVTTEDSELTDYTTDKE